MLLGGATMMLRNLVVIDGLQIAVIFMDIQYSRIIIQVIGTAMLLIGAVPMALD